MNSERAYFTFECDGDRKLRPARAGAAWGDGCAGVWDAFGAIPVAVSVPLWRLVCVVVVVAVLAICLREVCVVSTWCSYHSVPQPTAILVYWAVLENRKARFATRARWWSAEGWSESALWRNDG